MQPLHQRGKVVRDPGFEPGNLGFEASTVAVTSVARLLEVPPGLKPGTPASEAGEIFSFSTEPG